MKNGARRLILIFFAGALSTACKNSPPEAVSDTDSTHALSRADIGRLQKASRIQMTNNSLYIDGEVVPQLFGAELQYFRMRGGQDPDVAPAVVENLWRKALGRMKEAGMNAICFYIPWDFHETSEGQFDFDGHSHPARNLKHFLELVTSSEFNFKYVMVRPGPYINAQWGFLGFGAVPEWFNDAYPASHMTNFDGSRSKLYDYNDPNLLAHTKRWFDALHTQVLKDYIGPGKAIFALQIDNDTNYMGESIHNVNYSPANQQRFVNYLKAKYNKLDRLNAAYGTQFLAWFQITPPAASSNNAVLKRDWYEFSDESVYSYLQNIQSFWHELGVTHKDVLFTLAESYDAAPGGLIPNLNYRNDAVTGMQTVKIYPKTDEAKQTMPISPFLNKPFKADHDVRLADAANDAYWIDAKRNEWVMGPEIQGGWWRGTTVSGQARQQTYLSTLGHGLKALFINYFNEGDNWKAEWEQRQIKKLYEEFHQLRQFSELSDAVLQTFGDKSDPRVAQFWAAVSETYRRAIFSDSLRDKDWAQRTMLSDSAELNELYFDAPLDKNLEPREYFNFLKDFGNKIIRGHENFLAAATELTDDVVILKDAQDHSQRGVSDLDYVTVNTEWSAGLYAMFLHAGFNPKFEVVHRDLNIPENAKVVARHDLGRALITAQLNSIRKFVAGGGVVVNFLQATLAKQLGVGPGSENALGENDRRGNVAQADGSLVEGTDDFKPLYARAYASLGPSCLPVLMWGTKVVGYSCPLGAGAFIQIGVSLQDLYNQNNYYVANSLEYRNNFFKKLLAKYATPNISLDGHAPKTVAFARRAGGSYWVTLKNGENVGVKVQLRLNRVEAGRYSVEDLLTSQSSEIDAADLLAKGTPVELGPYDSKVLYLQNKN